MRYVGREQLRIGGPFAGRVVIEGATGILHMHAALERIDRFTDGFRLHLPGGMELELVLWHDIHHVTPSGDVAPGIGPTQVGVTKIESDEDGDQQWASSAPCTSCWPCPTT